MRIKHDIILIGFLFLWSCVQTQNNDLGGPCEGCEAIYEYGTKTLKSSDTLPEFSISTQKIKISGIVFELDGKTPAKDVILYVYHTNAKGKYPTRTSSKGWGKRHGYLRGWLKTDSHGAYEFFTSRPASYPNSNLPQHIHITVKEPNKKEYYIEDFYFADDPNLTENIRVRKNARGGSGVITLQGKGVVKVAKRNITLGLHIPNY